MRAHILALALGTGLAAAPAASADLALLIEADPEAGLEAEIAFAGELLAAQGYEVLERAGAGRAAIAEAMGELEARLGEADRLVLVFAGRTAEAWGRTWLLPADFAGEGRIETALDGVALDLLLGLAADLPGRSAVVVASTAEVAAAAGAATVVPQGVLLVSGEAQAALTVLTERLLAPDQTAADALRGTSGVSVAGFRSPDMGFASTPGDVPAPAARAADPTPEENEAALNLDQAARRGIQQDLTVLGFSTRGIDGIFGPGTRAAISAWQQEEGLDATGFIDPRQIARLRTAGEARGAELAAAAEQARREEEAADAAFWRTTGSNGAASDLRAYLERYPDGLYSAEARAALDRLEAASREAAAAEDRAAWENAQARDEVPAYARYLESFPDGSFAEQARARIEELDAAPREAALRAEAEAREAELGLNRASRALIEGQLTAVGFDAGETDGEFDRDARRAIRQFQTRQGLPVTGFIDQATVQALIVASFAAPR